MAGGCTSTTANLVESPLSVDQQQRAILEIVPPGSTRDEVEQRLKSAGIEYTPGTSRSIYYLSLWKRPDGQRWHINVALLFDGEGKLYSSRPADGPVGRMSDAATAAASAKPGWRKAGPTTNEQSPAPIANGDEEARVAFPGQATR